MDKRDDNKRTKQEQELYLYSLRKMAENNLESNRTFMTGLYNLRAFQYKADEVMRENPELRFAVIVMDLANFKSVNVFCGRDAGDGLLMCIADAFREFEGEHVVLSHLRADIFAMLTPFEHEEELVAITRQIGERIEAYKMKCKIFPAFGICIARDSDMPVSLMKDYAHMALKTIKGKFYEQYAFFDEQMYERMLTEKQIENEVVAALADGQMKLYVQPKVDMRNGSVVGGEALVRWQHPQRGIISPAEFIPIIEKSGFIINVDAYMWEEVFRMIGRRLQEGKPVVPVSINISRQHVYDRYFVERLMKLRERYHVPPEYVPLELTESGFLEQEEVMYANMKYLKQQGFRISMDDFGTGYSTMTMLKDEPVDEIKIDRGFLDDMINAKSRIIVSHVLGMLRDLDLDMIAEGVENEEQQKFLLDCGCTNAQGFYYYKPMPAEEFEKLIK